MASLSARHVAPQSSRPDAGSLFALAAFGYVYTTPQTYTGEAMVLIDNLDTPFDRAQPLDTQSLQVIDDRDVSEPGLGADIARSRASG